MAQKLKTKKDRKRLVILDTHAIIHRAYHAIPDFSSSKGEPTGALYGLASTLLKSIDDLKPDYIVAARDLPGKTKRHEVYEEYKATRVKTEPELVEQLEKAPRVFKAFGIPEYSAVGYEADDVIGSIVSQCTQKKDVEIIIVTGDMDILQLVDDERVEVYRMLTGLSNLKFYDESAVEEQYGFKPKLVPDFKGIVGDPSDNIKGVPGVGAGSAVKLLQTYGGITEIYKAIKKKGVEVVAKEVGVQKRYIQLIADNEESANFSRELTVIGADAPVDFSIPEKEWDIRDNAESIIALCDELEFRSLRARVRDAADTPEASVSAEEKEKQEAIDPRILSETSIALWLLHSDTTNPSREDIVNYANVQDFEKAREVIFAELKKEKQLNDVFENIERPLIPVVELMNETGISLDVPYLKKLSREYSKGLAELAGRIYKHAGREFNINSPKQLGTVLFDELKITPERHKRTAGGARTTRESELAKLSSLHPIIADVLAYRELQKLLGTYIEKMPGLVRSDGRLHAQFLQAGTTTGRMSSQDPNLQNIPIKSEYGRRIRKAFVPAKGFALVAIDYSQIELRVAAGLSKDEKLSEVFRGGGDIHAAVAAQVFNVSREMVDYEMRRRAKVINFGILYGMGVNALRASLGENVSRDEAQKFLDDYFKNFSGLARYIEKTKAEAARRGYTETLFGRRRYFPGLKSKLPSLKAQAERMAINAPIQGTQSDIIKLAMVNADKLLEKKKWRERAHLLLQVHDELVYEVEAREAEEIARALRNTMETAVDIKKLNNVPIIAEISIGPNWGDTKKIAR